MVKNRYDDIEDDSFDEDVEMERWLELTEAQQDAELHSAVRQWEEVIAQTPPATQYRQSRRHGLSACLRWRALLAQLGNNEFMRSMLKQRQLFLVKLRMWRASGYSHYPTSDH